MRVSWPVRIFVSTWIAYAGLYLCRKNFAVIAPLLQAEAGFSRWELGQIMMAFSVCYALGQIFGGPLADRLPTRLTVTGVLTASALCNFSMGFTITFAAFLVLSCLNGLSQSLGWPALVKVMARWLPVRKRGSVMAVWSTNYVLGGFIATMLAAFVISRPNFLAGWTWERGFWVPSALLFVIAAGYWLSERTEPMPPLPDSPQPASDRAPLVISIVAGLAEPSIRATAAIGALLKYVRYGLIFWLPMFMVEELNYPVAKAGYVSAVFEITGFAGALIAGHLSDRLTNARRFPVMTVMQLCLAAACLIHPMLARGGALANILGLSLIGATLYGPDTLVQGAVSQDVGMKGGVGATAGLVSGLSSAGQIVSPILVAWLASTAGWNVVFYSFTITAMLGALLASTQWRFTTETRMVEEQA